MPACPSPCPDAGKASSQISPNVCFPLKEVEAPENKVYAGFRESGSPVPSPSHTLWYLPSMPCRATERHEGNGKLVLIKATATQGTPTVIQEPHEVLGCISKVRTRVELPCWPPPTGVRETCEMFWLSLQLGLKVSYDPAVCGAVCLQRAGQESVN